METFCRLFSFFFVFVVRLRYSGRVRSTARHHMNDFFPVFLQMPYDRYFFSCSCMCVSCQRKCSLHRMWIANEKRSTNKSVTYFARVIIAAYLFFSVEFQELCCGVRVVSLDPTDTVAVAAKFFGEYIYSFLISLGIKLKHVGVIKSNK